jgi:hypothetical protein
MFHYTKKYVKNNKNKNNKNNKFKKLTRKMNDNDNPNHHNNNNKVQKGGSCNKEKFEVQSLSNFDFDKISLSKHINANINWGIMPGAPPKPDCTIL